ncbi:MAG: ThiF family adenylyltransferase [Candidatus Latescibacterota bacterium]
MKERYARQQLLEGWDQSRLDAAVLAIVGCGPLAFLCSVMAAAMGFGRIVLLGRQGSRPPHPALPALLGPTLRARADWLMRLNPGVRAYACPVGLRPDLPARLPRLDAAIVAGNDLADWLAGARLARAAGVPVLGGASAGGLGLWGPLALDSLLPRLCRCRESPLVSQVVAGLLVEEARRILLPLPDEEGPADRLNRVCIPAAGGMLAARACRRRSPDASLALVGAGALGSWFGVALGMSGSPACLALYDHDQIEETNLNRQILFHEAVGKPKATTLAARLADWFPRLDVSGCALRVERGSQKVLLEAGVLIACPDSFAVRSLLNDLGRRHRRPLLSGGTSAGGGSCLVYAPGATACLSCRLRIEERAAAEQAPARCGRVPEGSVVTSNAIVGALMVALLQGLEAGCPERGLWEYDGRPQNGRLARHSPWPACGCRGGRGS